MQNISILHVSFDYPDSSPNIKTKAVQNLIDSSKIFNHYVISLNRVGNPFKTKYKWQDNILEFNIFYLRYGFFLNFFLRLAARNIVRHLHSLSFDVVHSHKLTFEGVVGDYIAQRFQKKHIITIRGNTDLKVLQVKRFYRKKYLSILERSSEIISLSPWVVRKIEDYFRKKLEIVILPNISFVERFHTETYPDSESKVFITTFLFDRNNHKIKNLFRLLKAFSEILNDYPDLKLKIIGDGRQKQIIENYISKFKLEKHVILPGYLQPEELRKSMQDCIAFLMPSYPETFGLVYLEAMAAGLPVIYSRDAGIDGFFSSEIALGVNHRYAIEIYDAMKNLFLNQSKFKKAVQQFIANDGLKSFETREIVCKYHEIVKKLV
jgi:glycosyltransferase involved in cell wall biosynthesis